MPRNTLMPVFAMPRTTPWRVSTSKNNGPLSRALALAGAAVACAGVSASAARTRFAPEAMIPASPALMTLRRDRLAICLSCRRLTR